MSLYADDILLFVQNPKTSLTDIMKLTNEYSIISDYSINWTKSTILPLNMEPHDRSIQNIHVVYLGRTRMNHTFQLSPSKDWTKIMVHLNTNNAHFFWNPKAFKLWTRECRQDWWQSKSKMVPTCLGLRWTFRHLYETFYKTSLTNEAYPLVEPGVLLQETLRLITSFITQWNFQRVVTLS